MYTDTERQTDRQTDAQIILTRQLISGRENVANV